MHKLIRLNILAALALLAAGWLPAQSQKPEKKSGEEAHPASSATSPTASVMLEKSLLRVMCECAR